MSPFEWVAVAAVVVLSGARLTRLLTVDDFPPVKWFRDKYFFATEKNAYLKPWQLLMFCGYCMSAWVTAAVVGWGYWSGWADPWWLINGALGGSYLAAIVMAHDGDED